MIHNGKTRNYFNILHPPGVKTLKSMANKDNYSKVFKSKNNSNDSHI